MDELIELVRQHEVLYNTTLKEYKDGSVRVEAWEEIAETLNEPVENCKENWTKLRNAYASALKRRTKKSADASIHLIPWKYEDQMSFLQPYMKRKNSFTYLRMPSPPESPQLPTQTDSPVGSPLSSESLKSFASTPDMSRPVFIKSERASHRKKKSDLQGIYDLMKSSSNDLKRQRLNFQNDMDETDLFFLSMGKAIKALPKIEQTKIKLDLHTAISHAEIKMLEQTEIALKTPISIPMQQKGTTVKTPLTIRKPITIKLPAQQKETLLKTLTSKQIPSEETEGTVTPLPAAKTPPHSDSD